MNFALVGMGAEMTGSYRLILPLMIPNMSAYALARHWRSTSVYEALLLQDGVTLPHGRPAAGAESETSVSGEVPP